MPTRIHISPAVATLRERLRYDPMTGLLTWGVDVGLHGRVKAGSEAGTLSLTDGYRYVRLMCQDGKKRGFAVHRIAFALMTGEWPSQEVDHINCIRRDNRWANLREVSSTTNAENKRRPRSDSSTQVQGVNQLPNGRFRAQIRVNRKGRHVGVFSTASEAHDAYLSAKRALHQGCTL